MRSKRLWTAGLAALMALVLAAVGTYVYVTQYKKEVKTEGLGPNGGSVEQFGVKVTVPQGTLKTPTELRITQPTPLSADVAPLGAKSTVFDISFADGSQPSEDHPLALEVPLQGSLLPAGTRPEEALLYHKLPNNGGYRLYPSEVKDGVLRAQLTHLSEWVITVLGEEEAKRLYGFDKVEAWKGKCDNKVSLSGDVKVSLKTTNGNSGVDACIKPVDGNIELHVKNAMEYMWPVTISGSKHNVSEGNGEQKVVALIAGLTHPKGVKTYLPTGQELTVNLGTVSKPSTITLEANYHTWIADAVWRSIKVGFSLYFGLDEKLTDRLASFVFGNIDALGNCITAPIRKLSGKDLFGMLSAIPSIVFEDCGAVIEALASEFILEVMGAIVEAITGLKRVAAVGTATWTILEQSFRLGVTFANNLKGDIKFEVKRASPPCATTASFRQALKAEGDPIVVSVRNIKCSAGWAEGIVSFDEFHNGQDGGRLIRYIDGRWVFITTLHEPIFYGTPEADKLCGQLPADFRKKLCVRI